MVGIRHGQYAWCWPQIVRPETAARWKLYRQSMPTNTIVEFAAKPNTAEWLEERRKYMGASDAPKVLGMSRYGSPVEVAMEKRTPRASDNPPPPATKDQERGHILEPVIGILAARRLNLELRPGGHIVAEAPNDFMACTPDFEVAERPNELVECKSHVYWLSDRYGEDGSCDIDDGEFVQCQHQMSVTGASLVNLAVLFAAQEALDILVSMIKSGMAATTVADLAENLDFRIFPIDRDESLIESLVEAEREFWTRYVLGDEEPADIQTTTPTKNIRPATERENQVATAFKAAWMAEKRAKRDMETANPDMQSAIGLDEGLETCVGRITWKKNRDSEDVITDWENVAVELRDKFSVDETFWGELVKLNTSTNIKPGPRVLRVPKKEWGKEI